MEKKRGKHAQAPHTQKGMREDKMEKRKEDGEKKMLRMEGRRC
jgi:hypothetical protein